MAAAFRLRGREMTRIETFTDAAFAFALTLLVISLEPPTDMAGLAAALQQVPSFLLSATMLMMFWWGHHEWSRRYGLDDSRAFLLSCMLVFTVLVYVYPLRFMFGAMMAWIGGNTGLPLGSGIEIRSAGDVNTIFFIYGFGFCAMSAALALLNLHAWQQREALGLDAVERHETLSTVGVWAIMFTTGAVSTLAAAAGPTVPGLPGWVYATLPFSMTAWVIHRSRRVPASAPSRSAA